MSEASSKERDVMMVMRKVLTSIIRDTTPEHRSLQHPLTDNTIQDIRHCLALITAREKELADAAGRTVQERPYYADEQQQSAVVPMTGIGRMNSKDDS
ncbi:MAG: segregation and condensation protein A [gamma proteobacterium endosymbiont of Lamellibrachia anaximandri]|nr:segregation and condensation protein A [gamma proteobacterium endosymbiont of Lamellibrachia anaximandri]MBL3534819.1 segregation and condensation protein A [gamma proteobacterium endosymbiont of Lamellibrachia anaximandri]MBL3600647.1 segregation and condensation protein A [gamma proteobacterium endosymbiont of Lamellibrachia anaximandri]